MQRNADTLSHTHCSLIAATRGPTQVQSAHHTQRRGGKLTCSSTTAWLPASTPAKHPISFDSSCSTCPPRPRHERQAGRASHEQRNCSEGKGSNQRDRLGGGNTKQVYLNTKGRDLCRQETSVMQQIPLGRRVSRRDPSDGSCHLRRTR